jgi:hypothetical protein
MEQRSKKTTLFRVMRKTLRKDKIVTLIEDYEMVLRDLYARCHSLLQRIEYNTKIEE